MSTWSETLAGLSPTNVRDKSSASTPVAVLRDLSGCGVFDYIKVSSSAGFNYRLGCEAISPLANFSVSATFYNPDTEVGTGNVDLVYAFLRDHLSSLIVDELVGNTMQLPAASGILTGTVDPFTMIGNQYIEIGQGDGTGNGAGTVTLALPIYKALVECGRPVAVKMSSAVTYSTFDPDTCVPRLEVALSLSYTRYLKRKKDGADIGYVNSTDFDTNFLDSKVSPTAFFASISGSTKATISESAARAWETEGIAGQTFSVGDYS